MNTKRWNPKYVSGCVRHALELLPKGGPTIDLFLEAAEHLECTQTEDCRFYRRTLKRSIARVRRFRRLEPWEYWLLQAAERLLYPIPGMKHQAVTMLRSSVDEHDHQAGRFWSEWHDQHATKEPAYV